MSFKKSSITQSVSALILCTLSLVSASRSADAAIVMFTFPPLTGASTMVIVAGATAGTISTALAVTDFALQVPHAHGDRKRFYLAFGILLLVLDQEAGVANQSEGALAERYPFIEDRAVLRDLAQALERKAVDTAVNAQGIREVRISRDEMLEILAPTDLLETRPEQSESLIRDFR